MEYVPSVNQVVGQVVINHQTFDVWVLGRGRGYGLESVDERVAFLTIRAMLWWVSERVGTEENRRLAVQVENLLS